MLLTLFEGVEGAILVTVATEDKVSEWVVSHVVSLGMMFVSV